MNFPKWRGFNVYRDCAATVVGITAGPLGLVGGAVKKLTATNDNPVAKSNVVRMTAAVVAAVAIAATAGAAAPWLVGIGLLKSLPFVGLIGANLASYLVASPGWEAKAAVQTERQAAVEDRYAATDDAQAPKAA